MSYDIFDEQFYLANNPDVAAAVRNRSVASGRAHFLSAGQREGRTQVSSLFNEQLYLRANPDVAAAVQARTFRSGLEHYILSGESEGRFGQFGLFNEQAYLQAYPDVARAVQSGQLASGFEHFQFALRTGESRFNGLFNETFYLDRNPDIAAAVRSGALSSGLAHFLSNGQREGRMGGLPFEEGAYLRLYPDVDAAVKNGQFRSGLDHYAQIGVREGRTANGFSERFYRESYPDVGAAIAAGGFSSGLEHYLRFGAAEGRVAFFAGESGDSIVQAFGTPPGSTQIVAGAELTYSATGQPLLTFDPFVREVDTLLGSPGKDLFQVGVVGDSLLTPQPYYNPRTTTQPLIDRQAIIRGFDLAQDYVVLAGNSDNYEQVLSNGTLSIYYDAFRGRSTGTLQTRDLVATIPNVDRELLVLPGSLFFGPSSTNAVFPIFLLG